MLPKEEENNRGKGGSGFGSAYVIDNSIEPESAVLNEPLDETQSNSGNYEQNEPDAYEDEIKEENTGGIVVILFILIAVAVFVYSEKRKEE